MLRLIKKQTNIDFIGKARYCFIISGFLAVLGFFSFWAILFGAGRLGIDFTSGMLVQVNFEKDIKIEEVRQRLLSCGYKPDIYKQEGTNIYIFKTKFDLEFLKVLKKLFKKEGIIIQKSESISPKIGEELRYKAVWAVLLALIMILIYIAFRFEFKFGLAAVICIFHDVLAVLGILCILQKEITLLVVTAILTLAGYSLGDTVVVFDRIRESMRLAGKKKLTADIINKSINQVLSRTIITSLTTLLAVFALYIKGTEVTRDFAFTLLVGIIIGTYSSVFIASPLLLKLKKKEK